MEIIFTNSVKKNFFLNFHFFFNVSKYMKFQNIWIYLSLYYMYIHTYSIIIKDINYYKTVNITLKLLCVNAS